MEYPKNKSRKRRWTDPSTALEWKMRYRTEILEVDEKNWFEVDPHLLLGKGNSARVFVAREFQERDPSISWNMAAKVIQLTDDSHRNSYANECEAFARIPSWGHPNIVRYLYHGKYAEDRAVIMLERLPKTTIDSYIQEKGALQVANAVHVLKQLGSAVLFLHDLNITPRDVKCENISIDEVFNAKLFDFNLSRVVEDETESCTDGTGTPFYMAPEVVHNLPSKFAADMWSVGQVFYRMLVGHHMFHDAVNERDLKAKNRISRPLPLERFPKWLRSNDMCMTILKGLLHVDAEERWTASRLMIHLAELRD